MKILHVTNYLPGHHKICGGAEAAAYRQITALQEAGIGNAAVMLRADFSKTEDFACYQLNTLESRMDDRMGSPQLKPLVNVIGRSALLYDPVSGKDFRRIIRKEKPDIVNFYNFNRTSFSLLSAARENALPCVFSIYDYWCLCPNEILIKKNNQLCYKFHGSQCLSCYTYSKLNFLLRWTLPFRKPMFNRFLRKFDAFLVLSQSSRQLLEKYGIPPGKIETVPQFYPAGAGKPEPAESGDYILFAGWLNHKKGLHVLVAAMREVRARIKTARLVVLGMESDSRYLAGIKDYITENSLQENVKFLDKVGQAEFSHYLRGAGILVVPEQWENMSPVIIVEAMFAGVPVVASRIGGIPEFVRHGENGYLARHDDPSDFADKMAKLLSDNEMRARFSHRNKELSRKIFDKEVILNKLLRVYAQAIRKYSISDN